MRSTLKMNTIVCLKQVPDTSLSLKIKDDNLGIVEEGLTFVINPYDEFAVEEALKIKEKFGGTVALISLGKEKAKEALRSALAMGADAAIHINSANSNYDSFQTAKILAEVIKTLPFDILLCGKQAVDDDMSAVGQTIAQLLEIPHVSIIKYLEIDASSKKAIVHREVEGALEMVECSLPALFTTQKGLNVPRYSTLPGIMAAKKKEIKEIKIEEIKIDQRTFSPKTKIIKMEFPQEKKQGKILCGEINQQVKELVSLLKQEAKVL
jgi:electron transfer flavoprotein beta subunit